MTKKERILKKLKNNEQLIKVLENYTKSQIEILKSEIPKELNELKQKYPLNNFDITLHADSLIHCALEYVDISNAIYIITDREYFKWNEQSGERLKNIIDNMTTTFKMQFEFNLPIELKFLLKYGLLRFYNSCRYPSWLDRTSLFDKYIIKINETYPEVLFHFPKSDSEVLFHFPKLDSDVDIYMNDNKLLTSKEFKEFIIKLNYEFRDTLGLYTGIKLGYSKEFDLTNTIVVK